MHKFSYTVEKKVAIRELLKLPVKNVDIIFCKFLKVFDQKIDQIFEIFVFKNLFFWKRLAPVSHGPNPGFDNPGFCQFWSRSTLIKTLNMY